MSGGRVIAGLSFIRASPWWSVRAGVLLCAWLSVAGTALAQDAALDLDAGASADASVEATDSGSALPLDASSPDAANDDGVTLHAATDAATDAPTDAATEAPAPPPARGARLVLRSVLGLVLLVVLVWAASHPRLRRIEEWLGLRQVLTAGFAFVALGVIARQPAVGILSDDVLDDLTPVLHFALGWLGLVIGFQLDVRMLHRLPKGTAFTVATEALAPFAVVTAGGALLMVACGEPWRDPLFLRHAIALGAAGAVSVTAARERPGPWRADEPPALVTARIDSLDEIVGVIALAVVGAFFRPVWVHWRWELPGTVWLFVTLGMGASVGLLVYAMIRERTSSSEFLAIIVGGVALGAGMAGYVFLSPIVICFCIGAALANLPLEGRARLASVITVLERPVYYVLLTIGGALWDVDEPLGWALVLVFLASRLIGFLVARTWLDRASARGTPIVETTRALLRPISPISIAIVVSLQLMYRGRPISWIVTAVIGAAILTEALLQFRRRWTERGVAVKDLALLLILGGLVHAVQSFRPHAGEGSDVAGLALGFGLLMLGAFYAGRLLSRVRLPKVVAYLLVGVAMGPSALGMVEAATVRDLGLVNGVAVCLIALTAGSELDLRRFRDLLGVIRSLTVFAVMGTCVTLTLLLVVLRPLLPFLEAFPLRDAFAVAAMIGITLSAQSPAVVIAMLAETRADGPLSKTMLGTVVVADLVVIVLFSVASVGVQMVSGGSVDAGGAVAAIAWELLGSVAVGAAIGGLLILHLRLLDRGLILFVLLVCVVVAEVGRRVHLDPLIVMLTSGIVVQNLRRAGAEPLLHAIEGAALPVYLVFFALAGASMHVDSLIHSWLPATILVGGRVLSLWLGSAVALSGGAVAPEVRRWAFAGLLPQAGLALALAMLVSRALGEAGEAASALILAVIALNELLMPLVVRRALESSGEAGARDRAVEPEPAAPEPS